MQHPRWFIRTVISAAVSVATVISVAACGGGGAASTAPGASVAATTQPGTSAAAPSEAAPSAAPSTAAGGGGGGTACDLLTAADASGVLGGGTFTTEAIPGDPSYCSYKAADGSLKALTSYGQKDAKVGYDAFASAADTVKVSGLGDGAIWVPTLATLLVLKGGSVYGITAGTGQDDETQRLEWSKALGALAAARM